MAGKYSHYQKVYSPKSLWRAWSKVYENGIESKSDETQYLVKEFKKSEHKLIRRIYRQLLEERYKFLPAKGIPARRKGKTPRPIVIPKIPDRIVQRSILDILQEEPAIQRYFQCATSFGGVEGRGVRTAIKAAHNAIVNGACFYIRSDIEEFFRNIPREKVLSIISHQIQDVKFNMFLAEATKTELENLATLGSLKTLFPTHELGVAQGCCLSPLIGNILLKDFDSRMNCRGIICLRYIDDFLILGTRPQNVFKAFASAQILLGEHGLKAYDPLIRYDKANHGETKKGLEFLGCEISIRKIRPSQESCNRALTKIGEKIKKSIQLMNNPTLMVEERRTLVATLFDINNILKGWGNQYSFCNDKKLMEKLDLQVDQGLSEYLGRYSEKRKGLGKKVDPKKNQRRLLGVHLLTDSKSEPLIQ